MDFATLRTEMEELSAGLSGSELTSSVDGVVNLVVEGKHLYQAAEAIKSLGHDLLHSISGVDFPDRLEVVYHAFSTADQGGIVIKAKVERDGASLPTVTPL